MIGDIKTIRRRLFSRVLKTIESRADRRRLRCELSMDKLFIMYDGLASVVELLEDFVIWRFPFDKNRSSRLFKIVCADQQALRLQENQWVDHILWPPILEEEATHPIGAKLSPEAFTKMLLRESKRMSRRRIA